MAKSKMLSEMMGTKKSKKGKKKGKKSRKRGKAFNPKAMGLKIATEKSCLRGKKRRLKPGCIWGRGKYKGKIFRTSGR